MNKSTFLFILAAVDICNAALGYLSTGLNTKSITSAASQLFYDIIKIISLVILFSDHLQLDVETVRTTIDNLLWLYTECAKTKVKYFNTLFALIITYLDFK